jgi:hypothetical protein
MQKEPVRPDFLTPQIELTGISVFPAPRVALAVT